MAERIDEWFRQHPDAPVVRQLLRLPIVLWRLGLRPVVARLHVRRSYLVVLTVTGRSSGLPRHAPVYPHVVGGRTYLWCPYGGRSEWYRNLTASPVVTVQSRRGTQVMQAAAIGDDDEAIEVVAELRRFGAPWLHSYLAEQGIADAPEDIARNTRRLHVLRLDNTSEQGPPGLRADLAWLWIAPVAAAALSAAVRCRCPAATDISHRTT